MSESTKEFYVKKKEFDEYKENVITGAKEITKAEYDALEDKTGHYIIVDEDETYVTAKGIKFDDVASQIGVTNVQDAIDKISKLIHSGKILVTTNEPSLYGKSVTLKQNGEIIATSTLSDNGSVLFYNIPIGFVTVESEGIKGAVNVEQPIQYEVKLIDCELYGFRIEKADPNPATRVEYLSDCINYTYTPAYMDYTSETFNYGSWANAFFIKNLKPCMLKYDGTVDYELNKNDYTKKVDGTASDIANTAYEGNAMVGFPTVYIKAFETEDYEYFYICNKKLDDDFKCYAHLDNKGNVLPYIYMPIYNGAIIDSKLRSLSGQYICRNKTAEQEIAAATANGTGWYIELLADRNLINTLLLLIGRNTNSQTTFGNGNSYSGGLESNLLTTGTMNDKGLFWGSNSTGKVGVKVFGIENWWGNQWRRLAGWMCDSGIQKIKLTYGKEDGSTTDGFNLDGTGYITVPNAVPIGTSGGYIKDTKVFNGVRIPYNASGSETTYDCDGLWFYNVQLNYAFVGGDCGGRSRCGSSYVSLDAPASSSRWSLGASPSFKPRS